MTFFRVGEHDSALCRSRRQRVPPKKTFLPGALSGGGARRIQAGLLVGWSETGTRPVFDSVTVVSDWCGLVATLVFLIPDYDGELQRVYTTPKPKTFTRRSRGVRALLSDSLADNSPLERQIECVLTPAAVARLADEHHKAAGSTSRRPTSMPAGQLYGTWGAIAARGEPGHVNSS